MNASCRVSPAQKTVRGVVRSSFLIDAAENMIMRAWKLKKKEEWVHFFSKEEKKIRVIKGKSLKDDM